MHNTPAYKIVLEMPFGYHKKIKKIQYVENYKFQQGAIVRKKNIIMGH